MSSPGSPSTPKRPGSGGSASGGPRNSSNDNAAVKSAGSGSNSSSRGVARSSPRITNRAKETTPVSPVSSMHNMAGVYRSFCGDDLAASLMSAKRSSPETRAFSQQQQHIQQQQQEREREQDKAEEGATATTTARPEAQAGASDASAEVDRYEQVFGSLPPDGKLCAQCIKPGNLM